MTEQRATGDAVAAASELIDAARTYRNAFVSADNVWMANGRRGTSDAAAERVNRARLAAKHAHDRLMHAVDAYDTATAPPDAAPTREGA